MSIHVPVNPTSGNPHPVGSPAAQLFEVTNLTEIFFDHAIEIIDERYGPDYAKKNPHLVAALINSMTIAHSDQH